MNKYLSRALTHLRKNEIVAFEATVSFLDPYLNNIEKQNLIDINEKVVSTIRDKYLKQTADSPNLFGDEENWYDSDIVDKAVLEVEDRIGTRDSDLALIEEDFKDEYESVYDRDDHTKFNNMINKILASKAVDDKVKSIFKNADENTREEIRQLLILRKSIFRNKNLLTDPKYLSLFTKEEQQSLYNDYKIRIKEFNNQLESLRLVGIEPIYDYTELNIKYAKAASDVINETERLKKYKDAIRNKKYDILKNEKVVKIIRESSRAYIEELNYVIKLIESELKRRNVRLVPDITEIPDNIKSALSRLKNVYSIPDNIGQNIEGEIESLVDKLAKKAMYRRTDIKRKIERFDNPKTSEKERKKLFEELEFDKEQIMNFITKSINENLNREESEYKYPTYISFSTKQEVDWLDDESKLDFDYIVELKRKSDESIDDVEEDHVDRQRSLLEIQKYLVKLLNIKTREDIEVMKRNLELWYDTYPDNPERGIIEGIMGLRKETDSPVAVKYVGTNFGIEIDTSDEEELQEHLESLKELKRQADPTFQKLINDQSFQKEIIENQRALLAFTLDIKNSLEIMNLFNPITMTNQELNISKSIDLTLDEIRNNTSSLMIKRDYEYNTFDTLNIYKKYLYNYVPKDFNEVLDESREAFGLYSISTFKNIEEYVKKHYNHLADATQRKVNMARDRVEGKYLNDVVPEMNKEELEDYLLTINEKIDLYKENIDTIKFDFIDEDPAFISAEYAIDPSKTNRAVVPSLIYGLKKPLERRRIKFYDGTKIEKIATKEFKNTKKDYEVESADRDNRPRPSGYDFNQWSTLDWKILEQYERYSKQDILTLYHNSVDLKKLNSTDDGEAEKARREYYAFIAFLSNKMASAREQYNNEGLREEVEKEVKESINKNDEESEDIDDENEKSEETIEVQTGPIKKGPKLKTDPVDLGPVKTRNVSDDQLESLVTIGHLPNDPLAIKKFMRSNTYRSAKNIIRNSKRKVLDPKYIDKLLKLGYSEEEIKKMSVPRAEDLAINNIVAQGKDIEKELEDKEPSFDKRHIDFNTSVESDENYTRGLVTRSQAEELIVQYENEIKKLNKEKSSLNDRATELKEEAVKELEAAQKDLDRIKKETEQLSEIKGLVGLSPEEKEFYRHAQIRIKALEFLIKKTKAEQRSDPRNKRINKKLNNLYVNFQYFTDGVKNIEQRSKERVSDKKNEKWMFMYNTNIFSLPTIEEYEDRELPEVRTLDQSLEIGLPPEAQLDYHTQPTKIAITPNVTDDPGEPDIPGRTGGFKKSKRDNSIRQKKAQRKPARKIDPADRYKLKDKHRVNKDKRKIVVKDLMPVDDFFNINK